MRVLLILSSLLAVGIARPQYNYQSSENNFNHGLLQQGPQQIATQQQGLQQQIQNLPQTSSQNGNKYLPPASATQEPLVSKQFYLHSAPEDNDGAGKTKHFVLGRPQKNYRVVFIKAPSSSNDNVRLSAEYAPQEEKTVIYVLSQKENELDVNDIATPAPTQPSKPEVFFIKYKTPEEAAVAQKEIQNQYDKLGGTSEFNDQGTAPVSSVIGALDGVAPNGGYDYNQGGQRTPDSYLPPSTLKH